MSLIFSTRILCREVIIENDQPYVNVIIQKNKNNNVEMDLLDKVERSQDDHHRTFSSVDFLVVKTFLRGTLLSLDGFFINGILLLLQSCKLEMNFSVILLMMLSPCQLGKDQSQTCISSFNSRLETLIRWYSLLSC